MSTVYKNYRINHSTLLASQWTIKIGIRKCPDNQVTAPWNQKLFDEMNIVGAILFLINNNDDLLLPFIVGMVSSSELSICVCVCLL